MIVHKHSKLIAFGLSLVIILLVQSTLAADGAKQADKEDNNGQQQQQQLSIIGWDTYRKLFNKSYSSYQQLMVRQKIFMSKTLQVFLTAIKYRLNQIAYYISINRFSDLTPEEATKILSGDSGEDSDDDDDEDSWMDEEEARQALLDVINERPTDFGKKRRSSRRKKPGKSRRFKRSSESKAKFQRQLSFKDLIKAPSGQTPLKDPNVNVRWLVPPTNPDYEQIEQISFGVDVHNEQPVMDIPEEKLKEVEAEAAKMQTHTKSLLGKAMGVVGGAYNWVSSHRPKLSGSWFSSSSSSKSADISKDDSQDKPSPVAEAEPKVDEKNNNPNSTNQQEAASNDVVINDWRTSGCIAPPIDQGDCESCYAISSMSFVEWAFCMAQGSVLTPLSAQYMVSCGVQFKTGDNGRAHFSGCERGWSKYSMLFVQHYGVELEANMPYLATETECPIPPDAPPNKRGYIRPDVLQTIRMGPTTKQLDLALAAGPVIVSFKEPKNFLDYGGGMIDHCYDRGGHTMLIVGNGVEDGVDYLLIKNSLGTSWGMGGFFKFKRSAAPECVKQFITAKLNFPGLPPPVSPPPPPTKPADDSQPAGPTSTGEADSLASKIISTAR